VPSEGDNPDFQRLRTEAQSALDDLLAPTSELGGVAAINREVARSRAWARFDCWAPKWLQAAFGEIDRIRSWADLRQRQVRVVLELHAALGMDSDDWAHLICRQCGLPYPCDTRKAVLAVERHHARPK
jgi:hypothetical protein